MRLADRAVEAELVGAGDAGEYRHLGLGVAFDDLDLGDPVVHDRQPDRSHQASPRRHDDADGPIHERGPRQLRPGRSST